MSVYEVGSVYYRKDRDRWVATIIDGTNRRRYWYGTTEEDAKRKATEKAAKLNKGTAPISTPKLKLSDFLTWWVTQLDCKQSTRAGYQWVIDRLIKPRLGKAQLSALRPAHVRQMVDELGKKYPLRSVRYARNTLTSALKLAVELEILERNVAEAVKVRGNGQQSIPRRQAPPSTWSEAEVQAFLAAAKLSKYIGATYAL